jgi:hypothetical protein
MANQRSKVEHVAFHVFEPVGIMNLSLPVTRHEHD